MISNYPSFFWGIFAALFLCIILRLSGLLHIGFKQKFNKETVKYIPPTVVMLVAMAIVFSNYKSLLEPPPIDKKPLMNYLLTNPAHLQLLLFISLVGIIVLVWLVMTLPFNSQGLSKFSGFGISAEFREKVNAVVEKNAITNELTSIRENILRILTSDKYFDETLKSCVEEYEENGTKGFEINPNKMVSSVFELVETSYQASESNFRIQHHIETIKVGEKSISKKNVEELPKEMRDACLQVINKKKPFVWKGVLAMEINPFAQTDSYYVICLYSDDLIFTETDSDYLGTLIKVAEKIITLYWYQSEDDNIVFEEAN
ncbi:MAG: hypothetical protein ACQEXE_21935 [Bacillota bacterium]